MRLLQPVVASLHGSIAELLGIESRSILYLDATPLGVDGRPLNKSSEDELRTSFQKLISAVVTGVQQGDPDARPSLSPAGVA